jgi:hypothetical protein
MREVLRKCFVGKAGQQALEILDTVFLEMERERENLIKKACAAHPSEPDLDEAETGNSTRPVKRSKKAGVAASRARL